MNPHLLMAKVAAAVALIAAIYAAGHHQGASGVQSAWDRAKLAQITADDDARAKREAENAEQAARQSETNASITKAVNVANTQISVTAAAARTRGLYLPATACNRPASPATASSAIGSDDAPAAAVKLPDDVADALIAEAERADKLTEGYRALQDFVKQNGLAP